MSVETRRNVRFAAQCLACVSLAALTAPAIAATATIATTVVAPNPAPPELRLQPLSGNISAFNGNISAFNGNISAFNGNISAFNGNISAFNGNISAFYGNISAFNGNISAFNGNISAFNGNISAFQGQVDPFWGNISAFSQFGPGTGLVTPDYANIGTFWSGVTPLWTSINTSWANISASSSSADLAALSGQLNTLAAKSQAFWGAAVQSQTGKSFNDGFVAGLYAKYGIDPNNAGTLANLTSTQRGLFLLSWFDGLMSFTGTDHVDWWMKSANWTPSLTQVQGAGSRTVIGLLDFSVAADTDFQGNLVKYSGSSYTTGHGAEVASLLIAPHDGQGVMGIAPKASVVAYNPFDSTGTAGWSDLTAGITTLGQNGATVINASLGVPGYTLHQGWNDVFSNPAVAAVTKNTVVVLAAGNDGLAQTQNINWNFATNPNLLIVGSVGLTDQISAFSNQPGMACLLDAGVCKAGNRLMDHFITAPGELILVSDGHGGVTRDSGTSFAAPLVAGAVALLQTRWPWLDAHPSETASIILKSARDVGAPGVDPVYGAGILDVTASQSPLSFNNLQFYTVDKKGNLKQQDTNQVRSTSSQQLAQFNTQGLFYYAYEPIGATFRDFAIPLSSKLIGQTITSADGTQQQFQQYVYSRLVQWMSTAPTGGGKDGGGGGPSGGKDGGFHLASGESTRQVRIGGLDFAVSTAPQITPIGYRASQIPFQSKFALKSTDGRYGFQFGYGGGAAALGGVTGLTLASDYDRDLGGANPLLGLASGGSFAGWSGALGHHLSLSAGVTTRRAQLDLDQLSGSDRLSLKNLKTYSATADNAAITYQPTGWLTLSGAVTHLGEANSLLGVRSLDPNDFRSGSSTDAVTLSGELGLGRGFNLSASGTAGRAHDNGSGGTLAIAGDGLGASAYEIALDKSGLFDRHDRARLTLSQPLYVQGGKLAYTSVQVVDRSTGRLGAVTQTFDAQTSGPRYVGEALYGHDILNGAGEFGLFTRVENRTEVSGKSMVDVLTGARLRLSY